MFPLKGSLNLFIYVGRFGRRKFVYKRIPLFLSASKNCQYNIKSNPQSYWHQVEIKPPHCKKNCFVSGPTSGSIWKTIQIYLDLCPTLRSGQIRINFRFYPEKTQFLLMDNTITKSTKSYIVGNFSNFRIYLDKLPDRSG